MRMLLCFYRSYINVNFDMSADFFHNSFYWKKVHKSCGSVPRQPMIIFVMN